MSDSIASGVQSSLNIFKPAGAANNKTNEEIPVEVDDSDGEYHDDEFEDSQGSGTYAKVSISQSGRLPPLSGSYPHGATDKTPSATFLRSSKEAKNIQSPHGAREGTDKGSPTVKNITHGD